MCAVIIYSCAAEGETAFGRHSSRQRIKNMAEGERMVTCQLIKVVNCRPVVVGKGEDGKPIVKYEEVHDPKAPLNFVLVPGNKNDAEEKPTGRIYLQPSSRQNGKVNQAAIEQNLVETRTKCCFSTPDLFSKVPYMLPDKLSNSQIIEPSVETVSTKVGAITTLSRKQVHKDLYICDFCGKAFATRFCLQKHIRTHTGERPWICEVCGKGFSSSSGLWAHQKTHTDKSFLCELCGRKVRNIGCHLESHNSEKTYMCSLCGKSYKTGSSLSLHRKLHFIKVPVYTCELCGRSFKLRERYKVHVRRHQGDKRFHCSICDKKFFKGCQLKTHIRTHTGEKPFSCEICEKAFSYRDGLRLHRRQHTNEKPYSCPKCPKRFKSYGNMRTHVRQHFGIKPYSCELCKRRFTQNHSLKKHLADKVCMKTK